MDVRHRRLVAAWIAVPLAELYLALGACDAPPAWRATAEIAGFTLAGLLHARLAPDDWRASPAWPAVVLGVGTALRHLPDGAFAAVLVVCAVGIGVVAARVFDGVGRLPLVGVLLSVGAALGARVADLSVTWTLSPLDRLAEHATSPWRRHGPAGDGPPLVLVTVDTLRADAATGMESWRWLEARGAVWPRGMSASSWTVPSAATLVTGLPVGAHGARMVDGSVLQGIRDDVSTVALDLAGAGYDTAAIVTNDVIASSLGFRRGFRAWLHPSEQVPYTWLVTSPIPSPDADAPEVVVDRALRWLDGAPDAGFFLWIHLMGPHSPYEHLPPGSLDAALAVDFAMRVRTGEVPMDEARRQLVRDAYAVEVEAHDRALLRLFTAIEARGLLDRGVIAFGSDHGEELWEHGRFEHGHTHHGEVLDIGIAVVAPGLAAGTRTGVASLEDLAPTLRAAAGLPPAGLDLRQGVPAGRIAVAVSNLYLPDQVSARDERSRVIVTDGVAVRYDALVDPGEQTPLPIDPADPVARAAVEAAASTTGPARAGVAGTEEMLRAMGYVE